jgi:hypothetical protein
MRWGIIKHLRTRMPRDSPMTDAPSTKEGKTESDGSELFIGNYCVSFIDLLGQRASLRNQSLLIPPTSEEQQAVWLKTIRESIGAIASLQREAHQILTAATQGDLTGLRATRDAKDQALWDEMSTSRVTTQRWSDGLLSFCCLGDRQVKCQMNSVFKLFVLAGAHCFLGLARGQPVRGALEVLGALNCIRGSCTAQSSQGLMSLRAKLLAILG